jgi:hypothetical protein
MQNKNTPTEGQNSTKLETESALRDAKGRYHTQLACERLVTLLPENAGSDAPGEIEPKLK